MYNFTVKVTDSNSPASTATANLAITVASTGQPVAVTTTSLPAATVNTLYNALLTANGGITPYTWSILSGTLAHGLELNASTGQITGPPGSAGLWQFTIKVTDVAKYCYPALAIAVNTGDANGTLNGQYTFSFSGYSYDDGQLNNLVVAGSFTFNGNGGITGGEMDSNNNNAGIGHQFSQITGGTYSVNSNGLGQISFTEADGGGAQLLVSTGNAEDMRVIAYNTQGSQGYWGAGVMRQQNPADFNAPALAGNWAFGLQGIDSSLHPLAADGTWQEDSSGNYSGIEDINDFGTHTQADLTGRTPHQRH